MTNVIEKATELASNSSYPIIGTLPCFLYQISTGKLFICRDVPGDNTAGHRVSLVEKMLTNIFHRSMVFTTNEDKVVLKEVTLIYKNDKLDYYGEGETIVLTKDMEQDFIVDKLSYLKKAVLENEHFKYIEDSVSSFRKIVKDINATLDKKHFVKAYLETAIKNREAIALLRSTNNQADLSLNDIERMLDKLDLACYFNEKSLEVKITLTIQINSIFRVKRIPFVFKLEPTTSYVNGIELTSYKIVN